LGYGAEEGLPVRMSDLTHWMCSFFAQLVPRTGQGDRDEFGATMQLLKGLVFQLNRMGLTLLSRQLNVCHKPAGSVAVARSSISPSVRRKWTVGQTRPTCSRRPTRPSKSWW
jgi:hypothetical protein